MLELFVKHYGVANMILIAVIRLFSCVSLCGNRYYYYHTSLKKTDALKNRQINLIVKCFHIKKYILKAVFIVIYI